MTDRWQPHPRATPSDFPPVCVAIPAGAWMWTQSVEALLQLKLPRGSKYGFFGEPSSGGLLGKRNAAVTEFLAHTELDWLFMLDSDMTPPPETVLRLLAHERDAISALCFTRGPSFHTCAGWATLAERDGACVGVLDVKRVSRGYGVQRVTWTGTAALLVHRRVLERLPTPCFDWLPGVGPLTGEDVYFSNLLRRLDTPLFCDTDLVVGHLDVVAVDGRVHDALGVEPAPATPLEAVTP